MAVGGAYGNYYPTLIRSCQETWDSIQHPNYLKTVYFYGYSQNCSLGLNDMGTFYEHYTDVEETVANNHLKFRQMFKDIWHLKWDYLVAGSTSSYWDKDLLFEKVKTLPKNKVYCGIDGGGYASGAGRIFSRDIIKILMEELPDHQSSDEDALIGQLLRDKYRITPNNNPQRVQYNYDTHKIHKCYHYRCKELTRHKLSELDAFKRLFEQSCFI